ncbi:MAG TPA: hypothetical protein VMG41_08445 [Gemmatimonadales bacterium]|nr:hypothetical protein [Gemmatimonadales bacterium]
MIDRDAFYVGYHPMAPEPVARRTRIIVAALAALVVATAVVLALSMRPAGPGIFEYGHPRTYRGVVSEFPYPSLLVPGHSPADRDEAYTRYLLVAQGKHGGGPLVRGMDGRWVDLAGTRIARPDGEMLEIVPDGVRLAADSVSTASRYLPPIEQLGRETLSGEIVDSKCWLGVMKPATGNVHRGCGARCVHGGIPPFLMTTGPEGAVQHYLLTDAQGRAAPAWFAGLVSRRVTLTGEVSLEVGLRVMRVETATVNWP